MGASRLSYGARKSVEVRLKEVTKRFGDVVAVDKATFNVKEGEFFTLLGPSGCGKTTMLRIIAGFYQPDEGEVYFDDRLMNYIPPWKRDTGMVFQNYALWPHMNIFNNIAYGLRIRKHPKDEVKEKVKWALKLVGLEGFEKRTPAQLSGGQQQRVALARALVIEPQILLLDEPLSNLDAKVRVQVRTEIKKIQKQLKITSIYVTHDQEEALCISDRLAVMNKGMVEQVGTSREIYENPEKEFVADFIGVANFIRGRVSEVDEDKGIVVEAEHGAQFIATGSWNEVALKGSEVLISIRPEAISVQSHGVELKGLNTIEGTVRFSEYLGDVVRYEVEASFGKIIRADVYNPRRKKIYGEGEKVILTFSPEDTKLILI